MPSAAGCPVAATGSVARTGQIEPEQSFTGPKSRPGWDLPGYVDSDWVPVAIIPFDTTLIEPRMAPPVRIVEVIRARSVPNAEEGTVLDVGQNISGFVRLRVRGERGDSVIARHAEVLEANGSLHA